MTALRFDAVTELVAKEMPNGNIRLLAPHEGETVQQNRFRSAFDVQRDRIAELETERQELQAALERAVALAEMKGDQLGRMRTRHEERLVQLQTDAHKYANDQGYCSVFDDFMEEHNLSRRVTRYKARIYREVTIIEEAYVEFDYPHCDDSPSYYLHDSYLPGIDTDGFDWEESSRERSGEIETDDYHMDAIAKVYPDGTEDSC